MFTVTTRLHDGPASPARDDDEAEEEERQEAPVGPVIDGAQEPKVVEKVAQKRRLRSGGTKAAKTFTPASGQRGSSDCVLGAFWAH